MTDIRYQIRSRLGKVGIRYIRCKKMPVSVYLQIPFGMNYKSKVFSKTLLLIEHWCNIITMKATIGDSLFTLIETVVFPIILWKVWGDLLRDYENKDNLKGCYNRCYLFGISKDIIKELNLKEYVTEHNYKELP